MTVLNLSTNPMPRMPMRARIIIEGVMAEHRLCAEDFYSLYRDKHLVAARRAAAQKLLEIGYSSGRVGTMLKRNHSTILNYLEKHRERKRSHYASKRVLRHLSPAVRQIVMDYAKAESIKPELLIAQWVNERASYEAQAKARAA